MARTPTITEAQPTVDARAERRSYINIGLLSGLAIAVAILLTVWHNLPLDLRILMGVALLVVAGVCGSLIGWFVAWVTANQPTHAQH